MPGYAILTHTQVTVIEEHLIITLTLMRKQNCKKQYGEACHMTKPPHPPLQLLPLLTTMTTMRTCKWL